MDNLIVRQSTAAEIAAAPNLSDMAQAYAAESALPELGPAVLDVPAYERMEAAGVARFIGAWRDSRLVGFIILLTTPVPHWGNQVIASTESFFVLAGERHGGTGAALRTAAEAMAKKVGACGLCVSAPADGALERVLPHWGYRRTNSVFFKTL